MRGRVPRRNQTGVLLLDHDIAGTVDQETPKGEVALRSRAGGDLEGGPQVARIGLTQCCHGTVLPS